MRPHPLRTITSTLAIIVAVGLLFAGCGGDDSSSTTASNGTQPPDQLVQQADAICADADKERPSAPEIGVDPTAAELRSTVDFFEKDLDLTRQTYDELSDLAPPEGLEGEWATVLAGFKSVVTDYPGLIDAAKAGDSKAFLDVVDQIQKDTIDLRPAAAKVGLQVCASA